MEPNNLGLALLVQEEGHHEGVHPEGNPRLFAAARLAILVRRRPHRPQGQVGEIEASVRIWNLESFISNCFAYDI